MLTALMLACSCEPELPSVPSEAAEPAADLTCPADPQDLAATWRTPTGPGPFPTAVVLVGARPWDRWGDLPDAPWSHYRAMAEALVAAGAAVLLFDKGGTGATGGALGTPTARVAEAHAALACALAQPGADPNRVSFVGHSQGSWVASTAAVQGAAVQGLVLLSPVVELDLLAALPDGLVVTLVRGALDGADADEKRLQVLGARKLKSRHAVVPSADHLLLDASRIVPEPGHPLSPVHPAALRVLADAVTSVGRSDD